MLVVIMLAENLCRPNLLNDAGRKSAPPNFNYQLLPISIVLAHEAMGIAIEFHNYVLYFLLPLSLAGPSAMPERKPK